MTEKAIIWFQYFDKKNKLFYYYNVKDRSTQWETPKNRLGEDQPFYPHVSDPEDEIQARSSDLLIRSISYEDNRLRTGDAGGINRSSSYDRQHEEDMIRRRNKEIATGATRRTPSGEAANSHGIDPRRTPGTSTQKTDNYDYYKQSTAGAVLLDESKRVRRYDDSYMQRETVVYEDGRTVKPVRRYEEGGLVRDTASGASGYDERSVKAHSKRDSGEEMRPLRSRMRSGSGSVDERKENASISSAVDNRRPSAMEDHTRETGSSTSAYDRRRSEDMLRETNSSIYDRRYNDDLNRDNISVVSGFDESRQELRSHVRVENSFSNREEVYSPLKHVYEEPRQKTVLARGTSATSLGEAFARDARRMKAGAAKKVNGAEDTPIDVDVPLVRDYVAMAKIYRQERKYREKKGRVDCVICLKRACADVFFPCEHMCVCKSCIKTENICAEGEGIRGADQHSNCPLCNSSIKVILPYANGNEVESYWEWVYQIKPKLPPDFLRKFKHSAAAIHKIYIDDENDYQPQRIVVMRKKSLKKEGESTGGCSLS